MGANIEIEQVSPERAARAARLRDFFDLQLHFAEKVADTAPLSLDRAVAQFTTFHRRFGLGRLGSGPVSDEWRRYVEQLTLQPTHAARLEWTLEYFVGAPAEPASVNRRFGCFSCDPPDRNGVLRIHFGNRAHVGGHNADAVGPLDRTQIGHRTRELTEMFAFVAGNYPAATVVRGTSWLYHLDAYRRLFPPAYGDSRELIEDALRFQGYSNWGQFLDHRERVKVDLRERFLHELEALRPEPLWRALPFPALRTTAPIGLFLQHYGVR